MFSVSWKCHSCHFTYSIFGLSLGAMAQLSGKTNCRSFRCSRRVPSSCTGVAAGPPVTSKRKTIKRKGSPAVSRKINHLHITIWISEIQFIYFNFTLLFLLELIIIHILIVRYIIKLNLENQRQQQEAFEPLQSKIQDRDMYLRLCSRDWIITSSTRYPPAASFNQAALRFGHRVSVPSRERSWHMEGIGNWKCCLISSWIAQSS